MCYYPDDYQDCPKCGKFQTYAMPTWDKEEQEFNFCTCRYPEETKEKLKIPYQQKNEEFEITKFALGENLIGGFSPEIGIHTRS